MQKRIFTCPPPSPRTVRRRRAEARALFPRLVDLIPEGRSGNVEIKHCAATADQATAAWATDMDLLDPGVPYVQLNIDGIGWMHDTLEEQLKNRRIVREARGDVLIAGLGLGMILHPILKKSEVRSVLVLENNPHVVRLVLPSLEGVPGREKMTLQMTDAATWAPDGRLFETIWLDCLAFWARDSRWIGLVERWLNHYRPFLREGGYLGHWAFDEALEALLRPRETVEVHLDFNGDAPGYDAPLAEDEPQELDGKTLLARALLLAPPD